MVLIGTNTSLTGDQEISGLIPDGSSKIGPAWVAPSDAHLTGDQRVAGLIPAGD